jgi:hypothetical protein
MCPLYEPCCLSKPCFLRGHQSTQTLLYSFFPVLDLLGYIFALLLINLVAPPTFVFRFQPASLAPILFINFQFQLCSREFAISP